MDEIGNSQIEKKEQTFGEQILTGPPRDNGTHRFFLGCSLSATLNSKRLR